MKLPFIQFYPADWLMKTRPLSLQTKGAWIDILCILHNAPERGRATMTLQGWARVIGASIADAEAAIAELESTNVADIERTGNGDVTLISRRMRGEAVTREQTRKRVERHRLRRTQEPPGVNGNGHSNVNGNAPDTDRRQKSEDRSQNSDQETSFPLSPPPAATGPTSDLPLGDMTPPAPNPPIPFAEVLELYNRLCPSMPRARITDERRKHIRARWLECKRNGDVPLTWFANLFGKAEASDLLSGRRPSSDQRFANWRCTFDWLIGPRNAPKVIEGNYDNRHAPPAVSRPDIYTEPQGWREKAAARYPGLEIPEKWADVPVSMRNDLIRG
jgi:uncharacterized protein YdaU (DUF1376 family)